jgi:tetratricopeptide (TPR) repeat protein
MRKVFFLLLLVGGGFFSSLFAVSITMKEGKEQGKVFSTLTLEYNEEFSCIPEKDHFDVITEITCYFQKEPSNPIRPIRNRFFDIKLITKKRFLALKIIPNLIKNVKTEMYSFDTNVLEIEEFIPRKQKEVAKKWIFIAYESEKAPFIGKEEKADDINSIDFPVRLNSRKYPFVGALDVDGIPIRSKETQDIYEFLELKKLYEKGDYKETITLANNMLDNYPYSIFRSEILLYKIRSFNELKQYKQIINVAKDFLRNHSTDSAVAEVLLHSAYVHTRLGLTNYAKYYFERLFTEHGDTEFRNQGLIYLGDETLAMGKEKEALKLYKTALYDTKEIEIATQSAFKIGNLHLDQNEAPESTKYFSKIIDGNPDFFLRDFDKSYKLAKELYHQKEIKTASDILGILLTKITESYPDYEDILKDYAVWLDESGNDEEAFKQYQKYLDTYDFGLYDKTVRENQDKLLFARKDDNLSQTVAKYDKLIQEYGLNHEIGEKALFEKAKLYYDTKEFDFILNMEQTLKKIEKHYPKVKDFILHSAEFKVNGFLNNKKCEEAIVFAEKYKVLNKIKQRENDIFNCSFEIGKYEIATSISEPHLKDKDTKSKLDWSYKHAKILAKTGKYDDVVKISNDVIILTTLEQTDKYLDIYYDRYKAFKMLGKDDEVIQTVSKLEQVFKDDIQNISPYRSVVNIAKRRGDLLLIEKYASEIIKIQEKLNISVETPNIELDLIYTLKKQEKIDKAIEINEKLMQFKDMKKSIKAKAYYELADSYFRLGNIEKAKENYKNSNEADPTNPWGKLSKDALGLI